MSEDAVRVLVVANRTTGSEELLAALRERAGRGPATFYLVVPASPHGVSWMTDMSSGGDAAEHDLEGALAHFHEHGLDVEGEVGDSDPVAAVQDAANASVFDEVIVSTLPKHVSKWLHLDLPRRAAHATGLPVEHVVGSRSKTPA